MDRIVTFLSDFGLQDPFVGLCHAVLARLAPGKRVVDLTHGIAPGDVRRGAFVLADCVAYVPQAVHLAVVDPGVGSRRRGIAVAAGDALLVGPDNGLLWPASERLGGPHAAWELTSTSHRLTPVSATFHGRDVFAPAAAHLATGGDPGELGSPVGVDRLERLATPPPTIGPGTVRTEVRDVDHFGNIQLAVRATDAGVRDGRDRQVCVGERVVTAALRRTFADFPPGSLGLIEDSFGWLAVVCNGASAAEHLGARPGDRVTIMGPDD